jgi:fructose 1,6-bisphosphatase
LPAKTTVSVIKCDVGSLAGHHIAPKPLLDLAGKRLAEAQGEGVINSHYVFHAGDDLELNGSSERRGKPSNSQARMEHIPRSKRKSQKT